MPENIDSCDTCFYSRVTSRGEFCCCYNPPLSGNVIANFAPVAHTDWCGHWSQTGAATNIVKQTSIATTVSSPNAVLANTDNLVSQHYYGIVSTKTSAQAQNQQIIPKNTIFRYDGSPNIVMSQSALVTDAAVPATITDQAFA